MEINNKILLSTALITVETNMKVKNHLYFIFQFFAGTHECNFTIFVKIYLANSALVNFTSGFDNSTVNGLSGNRNRAFSFIYQGPNAS